jgi:hypothetical protein
VELSLKENIKSDTPLPGYCLQTQEVPRVLSLIWLCTPHGRVAGVERGSKAVGLRAALKRGRNWRDSGAHTKLGDAESSNGREED